MAGPLTLKAQARPFRRSRKAGYNQTLVGMVVNPKLRKPVLVTLENDEKHVNIWRGDEGTPYEGQGYFEAGYGEYSKPMEATGLPRVHTPDGVRTRKMGFGTTLYTGLCLTAHKAMEGDVRIDSPVEGDGISSDSGTRSASADAWWHQARKLKLAESVESSVDEENVDIDVDADELDGCVSTDDYKTITYVNTVNVDLSETIEADSYTYDAATAVSLVALNMTFEMPRGVSESSLRSAWKDMVAEEGQSIEDVYEDAIWAFDVRGLSQGVMNILAVALRESGASEDELHMLRFRWENNLDPDTPVRQMQLPFTPNSSEGRQVRAALQNVKELRKELGWNRLSKLP